MTVLTEGQIELRADTDAALVIGPGTSYRYPPEWVQWWDSPDVRTFDQARSGANGYTPGRDLLGKHATTFVVTIFGDDIADLRAKIDAWKAACAIAADDLITVRAFLFGETRRRYGRFRQPGKVTSRGRVTLGGDVVDGASQFETFDGLTYGDDLNSTSTARETEGSGFTPPFVPPFTLGSSVSGSLDALNAGNASVPWMARLDGPLTYPEITHTESGRRLALTLDANGGIDLLAGEYLTLDSATHSVLFNGEADRRDRLTLDSTWWDLDPGSNTFTLAADSGAGTLTVTWRDGYFS